MEIQDAVDPFHRNKSSVKWNRYLVERNFQTRKRIENIRKIPVVKGANDK